MQTLTFTIQAKTKLLYKLIIKCKPKKNWTDVIILDKNFSTTKIKKSLNKSVLKFKYMSIVKI